MPDAIPQDVLKIVGMAAPSPFADFSAQPVCQPDLRVTAQVDDKSNITVTDLTVYNARPGHLLMTPGGSSGVIGTILASLSPPQNFTHMGMFVDEQGTTRQATGSEPRVRATNDTPIDGYADDVIKYGWPGTVTQTWGDLLASCDVGTGTPEKRRDHLTEQFYTLGELGVFPVAVDIIDANDVVVRTEVRWPLVVRPHPSLSSARVLDALQRIARTSLEVVGHYRFYGYTQGGICRDPEYFGPRQMETKDFESVCVGGGLALDVRRFAATTREFGTAIDDHSVPLVCSTLIWETVRRVNEAAEKSEQPTIVLDGRPMLSHLATTYSSELSPVPRVVPEDQYSLENDGMYAYTEDERKKAASALSAKIHQSVAAALSKKASGDVGEAARVLLFLLTGGISELPDGNPVSDTAEWFTKIADHVTNQMCNSFASDDSSAASITSTAWQNPGTGFSVSPDDIIHNWAPPTPHDDASVIHGVYGFNERLKIIEPTLIRVPGRTTWQVAEKTTKLAVINVGWFDSANTWQKAAFAEVRIGGVLRAFTASNGQVEGGVLPVGIYWCQATWTDPSGRVWQSAAGPLQVREDEAFTWTAQLSPPSELAREVLIYWHADIVNRYAIGKDVWTHPGGFLRPVHLSPARFDPALESEYLEALSAENQAAEATRIADLRERSTSSQVSTADITVDDWGICKLTFDVRHDGISPEILVKGRAELSRVSQGEFDHPVFHAVDHEIFPETVIPVHTASTDARSGVKFETDLSSGAPWPARVHFEAWVQNLPSLTN